MTDNSFHNFSNFEKDAIEKLLDDDYDMSDDEGRTQSS